MSNRLEELRGVIAYHDDLYYNQDSPELDDDEYDDLVREYLALGGSFDDVAKGEASSKFEKVKHLYPVKSLDKIHTEEEVREALVNFAPGVIQPKLDGLTEVVYGPETIAPETIYSTKGSGGVGEKVNHTSIKIEKLNGIKGLAYRVEVYMPISKFNAINAERIAQGLEPFKNPRNAAAGMVRNSDGNKVQGLTYMAYNIMGTDKTETQQLELLKAAGLITVPSMRYDIKNIEDAVKFIMSYADTRRDKLDYEIDGLVIKSDLPNAINTFGETGHHYKNAVAFKFPGQGQWTKLQQVVYQVGRTGQITPVAEFEPVDILGSTISRATLHNYDFISKMGISQNCELFVIKANDVIPKVIKVRNAKGQLIPMAIYCPECGKSTYNKGANTYCSNAECKATYITRTVHFGKKDALNIEGLSIKTVAKMFEIGILKTPYDLFHLTPEQIVRLDGFAKPSAEKLYRTIQKARIVELDKFLYAAGVPLVGRSVSRDIANRLYTFPAVMADIANNNGNTIATIPGVGAEILKALKNNIKAFVDLSSYITPMDTEKPVPVESTAPRGRSYTFVITGKLAQVRSYYENLAAQKGHKVVGKVTHGTDYLVNNDVNSTSSKNKDAKKLGVPIISESQFMALMDGLPI